MPEIWSTEPIGTRNGGNGLRPDPLSQPLFRRCRLPEIMIMEGMKKICSYRTFGGHSSLCRKTVRDRKSTRLNSSHVRISYAVFCLKKKKKHKQETLYT